MASSTAARAAWERQRIKRKARRWLRNFEAMPQRERFAVLYAILDSGTFAADRADGFKINAEIDADDYTPNNTGDIDADDYIPNKAGDIDRVDYHLSGDGVECVCGHEKWEHGHDNLCYFEDYDDDDKMIVCNCEGFSPLPEPGATKPGAARERGMTEQAANLCL